MGPAGTAPRLPAPGAAAERGVDGGEVPPPSLLRSLRVLCVRDCESSPVSAPDPRWVSTPVKDEAETHTCHGSVALLLFPRPPPPLLDALQ